MSCIFKLPKENRNCAYCKAELCDGRIVIQDETATETGIYMKRVEAAAKQAKEETISLACKWLDSRLPIIVDYYNENIHEQADRDDFIREFREYMEEKNI